MYINDESTIKFFFISSCHLSFHSFIFRFFNFPILTFHLSLIILLFQFNFSHPGLRPPLCIEGNESHPAPRAPLVRIIHIIISHYIAMLYRCINVCWYKCDTKKAIKIIFTAFRQKNSYRMENPIYRLSFIVRSPYFI